LTPLTVACVDGVVAPPAMNTDGVTVAVVGSLVLRVTVIPFAGAAGDKVTGNPADWLGATATFDGRVMLPIAATITPTLAGVIFGALLLAVIVDVPLRTPVMGTFTVVAVGAKLTEPGTVAALVFDDPRLTVRPPAGAGADRVNVTFCVVPAPTLNGPAEKLRAAPTVTVWVPDV